MKKISIMLFALAAMTTFGTKAQDIQLPQKNDLSLEVQFNPFDQDGETFKLDGLKLRYFITGKDAVRVKLGFGVSHFDLNTDTQYEEDALKVKNNTADLLLDLGYERHFNVHKRISLYAGGSLGFTRHFAGTRISFFQSYEDEFEGEITNGAISEMSGDEPIENLLNAVTDRAFWGFNTAVFTGIDFYVYKGLYIGTELGIGLQTQTTSQMKYSGKLNGEKIYDERTADRTTAVSFKHYIEPTLRLGWTF